MGLDRYDVLIQNRKDLLRCLTMLNDVHATTEEEKRTLMECLNSVVRLLTDTEDELRSYYQWRGDIQ